LAVLGKDPLKIGQLVTPWFYVDNFEGTPEELLAAIKLASDLIQSPKRSSTPGVVQ
jgi:hypothetical protein